MCWISVVRFGKISRCEHGGILALGVGAFIIAACSSFNGESDPPAPAPGSSDDGGADGDAPVVTGNAPGPLGLTIAGPVRITDGGTASIKVSLNPAAFVGSVRVFLKGLPKEITASALVITYPDSTGELQLTAAGDAAQGAVTGVTVGAQSQEGVADSASLDLFVRGASGSLDTTYAMAGSMDLGVSTYAHSKRYTKYLFVGTSNGGLRRFAPDGTLDTAFAPPLAGSSFSMAPDESVFAYDFAYLRHYSSAGVVDPNFVPLQLSPATYLSPQIGPSAMGDVALVFSHNNNLSPATMTVSATGVAGSIASVSAGNASLPGAIEAQSDGTFLVGLGNGGVLEVLRIKPDATVDTTFATMGASAVAIPSVGSMYTGVLGLHKTSDGTYLVGASPVGTFLMRQNNLGGGDSSFGDGTGTAITQVIASTASAAFDIDSAGRPIVGYSAVSDGTNLTLSRYTKKGLLDGSFGTSGSVTLPLGVSGRVVGLHIVDDERVLVVSTHDGDAFIQRIWL